ncbi:uncharacterized protein LOC141607583 [Silene latifolia]|uniref:uncharacterized protein LOC141607583 n=1 Tax=Silene latifolia TaxID=37657 RepID=UPI003D78949B
MKIKPNPMKKRPVISSSSNSSITNNLMMNNNNNQNHDPNHNQVVDDNPSKKSASNVSEITDNTSKLRIRVPRSTSSRFGNVSSPTNDHDYDFPTDFPPDFARASAEFYTPTYQAMKNSAFFSNKQREKSKRLSNASTLYESTIGNEFGNQSLQSSTTYGYESSRTLLDGFHPEVLGLLPPVPEDFAHAIPVDCEVNAQPKPFKEFLDEFQCQKERAESGASRKESYTNLLRKLRIKEDAIEAWESKQKNKVEDQLDKLERRLEKKRAKAVQRTHKRLMETEMEAEKRKAIARRAVMKEMSKLQINI